MREAEFLVIQRKEHGNAMPMPIDQTYDHVQEYTPTDVDGYETQHGVPYIVDFLNIKEAFTIDPQVEIKARGVDKFIRETVKREGLREGEIGWKTILERYASKLPQSLEVMSKTGNAAGLIDLIFQEAAMQDGLSDESYLKRIDQKIKLEKVASLKQQIKSILNTL